MTPEEIKQELAAKGISMASIGRRLRPKVSRTSVQRIVNQVPGHKSERIQNAVANAIGRPREEVFEESGRFAAAS